MTIPGLRPVSPEQLGHLDWCLPGFCESPAAAEGLEDGTLHRSAPIVWRMGGDDADVVMRRSQYGLAGETFYEVHLEHRAYPGEITLTFSEDDVNRLVTGVHELRECR